MVPGIQNVRIRSDGPSTFPNHTICIRVSSQAMLCLDTYDALVSRSKRRFTTQ